MWVWLWTIKLTGLTTTYVCMYYVGDRIVTMIAHSFDSVSVSILDFRRQEPMRGPIMRGCFLSPILELKRSCELLMDDAFVSNRRVR